MKYILVYDNKNRRIFVKKLLDGNKYPTYENQFEVLQFDNQAQMQSFIRYEGLM